MPDVPNKSADKHKLPAVPSAAKDNKPAVSGFHWSHKCPHCRERQSETFYYLCLVCYNDLSIEQRRELYASRTRSTADPSWLTSDPAPLPDKPTEFEPGTSGKIAIMQSRLAARQQLTHPADKGAKQPDDHDFEVAFADMMLTHFAPHGIHWCQEMEKYRARPWFGDQGRHHIAYYRNREDAIRAVKEWLILAKEIGPRQAAFKIRREKRMRGIE